MSPVSGVAYFHQPSLKAIATEEGELVNDLKEAGVDRVLGPDGAKELIQ